eukprot:5406664-Pyramimonas_sp.AAC.1
MRSKESATPARRCAIVAGPIQELAHERPAAASAMPSSSCAATHKRRGAELHSVAAAADVRRMEAAINVSMQRGTSVWAHKVIGKDRARRLLQLVDTR